jgi:hypothetical protein
MSLIVTRDQTFQAKGKLILCIQLNPSSSKEALIETACDVEQI